MRRLKTSEVAPVRERLMLRQDHKCAGCGKSFKGRAAKKPALDHCHTTGRIRGVLCLNCNQLEGKLKNISRRAMKDDPEKWLLTMLENWRQPSLPLLHPTHKTDAEKRAAINKKARERRAKLKEK